MTMNALCIGITMITAGWTSMAAALDEPLIDDNQVTVSLDWLESTDLTDWTAGLEHANATRVVQIWSQDMEDEDRVHRARLQLIRWLHEEADFDVLLLPVGSFEAAWTHQALQADLSTEEAAAPLYRVWRESEDFRSILAYLQEANGESTALQLAGGLCRFHATGKELYSPHLLKFLDEPMLLEETHRERIQELVAGRSRLSQATPEHREQALSLAQELLTYVDEVRDELVDHYDEARVAMERQHLVNLKNFVTLEQIRGGDRSDDGTFAAHEKSVNLNWWLREFRPKSRVIYWEGRGDNVESPPVDLPVFRIQISDSE